MQSTEPLIPTVLAKSASWLWIDPPEASYLPDLEYVVTDYGSIMHELVRRHFERVIG